MKNDFCFFGEMLLRLSCNDGYKLENAIALNMNWGGCELNSAIILQRLGEQTNYVTSLPCNDLGYNAKKFLLSNEISIDDVQFTDGRCGLYYYEPGASERGGKVIYDRKYSAFSFTKKNTFNWKKILNNSSYFVSSGITCALNSGVRDSLFKALEYCKKNNIKTVCDVNYRKALWSIEEASENMKKVLENTDICIINEEHASQLFNINSSKRDSNGELTNEGYIDIAKQIYDKFKCEYVVLTIRLTVSSNENIVNCMIYNSNKAYFSKPYTIHNIVDRIGGGDAFTGALLYSLKNEFDLDYACNFAVGANVLKHSLYGDVAYISKQEIDNLVNGLSSRLTR